jgi:hypothetical protein
MTRGTATTFTTEAIDSLPTVLHLHSISCLILATHAIHTRVHVESQLLDMCVDGYAEHARLSIYSRPVWVGKMVLSKFGYSITHHSEP